MAKKIQVYYSKVEKHSGRFFATLKNLDTGKVVMTGNLTFVIDAIEAKNWDVVSAGEVMSWARLLR